MQKLHATLTLAGFNTRPRFNINLYTTSLKPGQFGQIALQFRYYITCRNLSIVPTVFYSNSSTVFQSWPLISAIISANHFQCCAGNRSEKTTPSALSVGTKTKLSIDLSNGAFSAGTKAQLSIYPVKKRVLRHKYLSIYLYNIIQGVSIVLFKTK